MQSLSNSEKLHPSLLPYVVMLRRENAICLSVTYPLTERGKQTLTTSYAISNSIFNRVYATIDILYPGKESEMSRTFLSELYK